MLGSGDGPGGPEHALRRNVAARDSSVGFGQRRDGTLVSHDHMMLQRDSYYDRFGVSPTDENRLYFLSPNYVISLDGGHTFLRPNSGGFASAGGDNHDLWIDPLDAKRIMVANDAGA